MTSVTLKRIQFEVNNSELRYDDEFLDKMGTYYSSDTTRALFPYIQEKPFEEWVRQQYLEKFQGSEGVGSERKRNLPSGVKTISP